MSGSNGGATELHNSGEILRQRRPLDLLHNGNTCVASNPQRPLLLPPGGIVNELPPLLELLPGEMQRGGRVPSRREVHSP
jgi:hypothetical protein